MESLACRYGTKCYKKECSYEHPDGRNSDVKASNYQSKSMRDCRNGNDCRINNCRFLHPKDARKNQVENYYRQTCKFGNNCRMENCKFIHEIKRPNNSKPLCRYKNDCRDDNCKYEHPKNKSRRSFEGNESDEDQNIKEIIRNGKRNKEFENKVDEVIPYFSRLQLHQKAQTNDEKDETKYARYDNSNFQWFWQKDSGSFEPYDDQFNLILEKEYRSQNLKLITPSITRMLDGVQQAYTIDFKKMVQINNKTKYERKIKREQINISKINAIWQFEDEGNVWKPFDRTAQVDLEQAFSIYRLSNNQNILKGLRIAGSSATYTIDFLNKTQMNEFSLRKRKIRKLEN